MAIARIQVTLDHTSGLAENAATTTFHVNTGIGTPDYEQLLAVASTGWEGQGTEPGFFSIMSNDHCAGTGLMRVYNVDDEKPRVPRAELAISGTPANTEGMPPQIALCYSFQGARVSGIPQARRRGRNYVPWPPQAANSAGRPTTEYMQQVWDCYVLLSGNLLAADDSVLGIWSTVDEAFTAAVDAWIDNSWDVQRRRGIAPSLKFRGA